MKRFTLNIFLILCCLNTYAQTVTSKNCGSCHKPVSVNSHIGQKCPHCGVTWGRENSSVSSRTMLVDIPIVGTAQSDNYSADVNNTAKAKYVSSSSPKNNAIKRSTEAINRLNSYAQFCGLSAKSTSKSVYSIFGKPTDIRGSGNHEVWFYDIEKFSIFDSNKKVMFSFNNTTQMLSDYTLILDLSIPNSDQVKSKQLFKSFLKNERKLDLAFANKFDFQSIMGLPNETAIGDEAMVCRYLTDKIYIDAHWRKNDYRCELFKVSFE